MRASWTSLVVLASLVAACDGDVDPGSEDVGSVEQAVTLPPPQTVSWSNVVNASASGGTLTKTAGCNGCDDAGGTAQPSLLFGSGYIEFNSVQPAHFLAVGIAGSATISMSNLKQQIRFN